jgi:hypothetical protein
MSSNSARKENQLRKVLVRLLRQSPAMVVAMLALFVALTGTAVATTSALITGNQIKNSSITGLDVKNKSLTPRDFRGSVRGPRGLRGLTGATGATGASGAKGDKGDKGDAGRSALTPLQSGETVYGTIGSRHIAAAAGEFAANASLPIPAPVALDDDHVTVDGTPDEVANTCTGTSANPTAPAGHVCMYPYFTANLSQSSGHIWGGADGTVKWGFQVSFSAAGAGGTVFFATWAYTAP